ncbi:MAG: M23 family metallopeptidase [Treponema sp.]|nr:M23 family metallopeptidase [Treponema sp.]
MNALRCTLCIALITGGVFLQAMDWPSQEGKITGNFGSNNEGRPLLGNIFESEGNIAAADRGELLFRRRSQDDCSSPLPSPLGAWVALDHGDGIISIYSRIAEGDPVRVPGMVEKNSPLGGSGTSGWSDKKGFYFSLFDRRERRWINPSMIITPLEDARPPLIVSVSLTGPGGRSIDPSQTRTVSQGRYLISVGAADTLKEAGESPLAPHRIVCMVNGVEIGVLNFETYSARDGALMVYRNGLIPVKEVFAPYPAWEVGEIQFTRGQAVLEVIAQDIAGNSRNAVFRLQVE